ncbi:MAG: alpha/beta hydrolase, partial [Gammaproteobacteria bacterium]|nr:alpha/beta hydrolase [Gammaproteobacteria bacterium]
MSAATLALDDWLDRAQFLDHESHRIAYWTAGEGRPLLLIHGFPTSSWDWHQVWGALAER